MKRLSLVLYQLKTIPDIKENFKIFDENIQNKVPNYFHFFTEFLEKISETSSAVVEPQEIYAVISALLIKVILFIFDVLVWFKRFACRNLTLLSKVTFCLRLRSLSLPIVS